MKEKKKKYIIISLIIILIITLIICIYFLFLKPKMDEQKETKELVERVSKSKQELDDFYNSKDKELQEKLDLLDKGYNIPTESYFSSPENIKLKYNLEQKGYKFNTVTMKNENSTYFSNNNYSISCIININTNEFISVSFWDKSLKGNACSILNTSKNITEEEQNQYTSYLKWIKENNLTLEQLKDVLLDYYLDNK
jgi:LAS superfamily LD-carboxypeptidase LdcB